METIIFVGLILSGLLFFFVLTFPQNTKQDEQDKQLFSPATEVRSNYNVDRELKMTDNGGTRLGIDRRKFEYTACVPEQRTGMDRRKGLDRRSSMARRRGFERRNSLNHRRPYPIERRDIFRTQS
ncbi:MAG: hypothetical protein JRE62_13625 [Deltaproteobacteria bacterium]|jgi:hypothetical protein|nr:hypothetical protein [Deltaproteobacteria bacterium]